MKNHIKICIIILGFTGLISGCEKHDDIDYPNTPPVITLTSNEIIGIPGQEIVLTGSIEDEFGIKFLSVECPGINLKKLIDISDNKWTEKAKGINKSYEINLTHKIPASIKEKELTIYLNCKNITGQESEEIIKLLL